ncbi:hypothetical protein Tco_0910558 [Tanacetum coccineum]|uniref:Reverse transcriptase domain-containing protein n=1 Tax=Tanacetum coccineum TaxID=301880 RepID=A0ABQ5CWE6_9ASTR
MAIVKFHCPFVGLNGCNNGDDNGLSRAYLIKHLWGVHCSGDAQTITKHALLSDLVVYERAELTLKRMGIWLCGVCFKTHTIRIKCRHGNDLVPPPDNGNGDVRFVLYDLTRPLVPSCSLLDRVDGLLPIEPEGFTLSLLDSLFSKGLRTVKSIPLKCRLGFSRVLKGALDKVICKPDDISCWVSLLVLPLCLLKTFCPRSNLECKSANKRQRQEESITSAIRSWGVPGGSLQLVRETLAESAPPMLDLDGSDHDLTERNLKQCKRKICDGHYTAAMRVLSSSGSRVFPERRLFSKDSATMIGHSLDGYLEGLQFGIGVPGGGEAILHAVNHLVEDRRDDVGLSMLLVDFQNAFNLIRGLFNLYLQAWYLDDGTIVGDTLEDPKSRLEGIFPPNISWPLHGVKLLGGPVSVDVDFGSALIMKRVSKTIGLLDTVAKINDSQCELLLIRACAGVSKLYFAMRTCPPRVFESAQLSFDMALRSALERIVTASGPGFGDWQWRLATLPFAFGGLGVYSACDVLNYAFVASRLQSAALQTKLLRHVGIVASGPTFDDALCVFNKAMEIDFLSTPSDVAAPKLMKKMADIYFTRVTKGVESSFSLSLIPDGFNGNLKRKAYFGLASCGSDIWVGTDNERRALDVCCRDLTGPSPLTQTGHWLFSSLWSGVIDVHNANRLTLLKGSRTVFHCSNIGALAR